MENKYKCTECGVVWRKDCSPKCKCGAEVVEELVAEEDSGMPPDYAYSTIEDYEKITGFTVSDVFRTGWAMGRITNKQLRWLTKQGHR